MSNQAPTTLVPPISFSLGSPRRRVSPAIAERYRREQEARQAQQRRQEQERRERERIAEEDLKKYKNLEAAIGPGLARYAISLRKRG